LAVHFDNKTVFDLTFYFEISDLITERLASMQNTVLPVAPRVDITSGLGSS